MGFCVVFNPADPVLRTLTPAAWLLLELCDGRSVKALRTAFVDAVGPARGIDEAERWFDDGIASLCQHRLIETADAAPSGEGEAS
jgi:hypothetical protein